MGETSDRIRFVGGDTVITCNPYFESSLVRTRPYYRGINFNRLFPDGCFPIENNGSRQRASQARDLLQKMLELDPEKRTTIDDALRHPYANIW